jgi:multiple sugar transport system permease protein
VPLAVLLLCAYMRNLPAEVEEQGMVDGCNRLRVIWHVVATMALPGIISAAILVFLQAWGEYIVAPVLVGASSTATLPVVLEGFVGKHATAFGPMFAAAVISIVPVWVLFFAMQKRFIGGLTLGSAR